MKLLKGNEIKRWEVKIRYGGQLYRAEVLKPIGEGILTLQEAINAIGEYAKQGAVISITRME